jgi:hypothetical protein
MPVVDSRTFCTILGAIPKGHPKVLPSRGRRSTRPRSAAVMWPFVAVFESDSSHRHPASSVSGSDCPPPPVLPTAHQLHTDEAAPHLLTTLPHRCQTAAAPRAPYSLIAAPLPRQPETLNLMSPPPPPLIHHPVRRWRTRHHLVPPPPPLVSATTSRCCRALPPLSPVAPPPLPLGRPTAGPGWAGASWVTRLRGGATG